MRHALREFDQLRKKMGHGPIILFLDYDGTLTPIVSHPDRAIPTPLRQKALQRMARTRSCTLFIISGRSRSDVKRKMKGERATGVGDHGFDIDHPPRAIRTFIARRPQLIKEVGRVSAKFDGAWVEKKPVTFSVHYRKVPTKKQSKFLREMSAHIRAWEKRFPLHVTRGKKVLEFRPDVRWNKGSVVQRILRSHEKRSFPIYVGDDVTDEDAFRIIRKSKNGIGVRVGRDPSSSAQFFL